ncbi:MAG: hypothetical protein KDA24_23945, partial [Deltaproteobacteria bacterium]|nr:hypothetical protein [Deltaproteobacteria bacterium]
MSFSVRLALVTFLAALLLPGALLAQETLCADGVDNDTDTFTDCLDGDCVTDAACASEDFDGDGVINSLDPEPLLSAFCGDLDGDTCDDCWQNDGPDTDNDGICNATDTDDDGDGFDDTLELQCLTDPVSFNPTLPDNDFDGICDNLDPDDDNDGWDDVDELACSSDVFVPTSVPADVDTDSICDPIDPCVDVDGDGIGTGAGTGTGCLASIVDIDDSTTSLCGDSDLDLCEDCLSASFDPANDGPDFDSDGLCNAGDPDDDNDGWTDQDEIVCGGFDTLDASVMPPDADGDGVCDALDGCADNDGDGVGTGLNGNLGCATALISDSDDTNPNICGDSEPDTCEDCSSGTWDDFNDGPNNDGDNLCNAGDPDDDNDGFTDVDEGLCNSDPLDAASVPPDADGDGICDILDGCLGGDVDGDGLCDDTDDCIDSDGDGLGDGTLGNVGCVNATTDSNTGLSVVCADTDIDTCDDCTLGLGWDPANDGPDTDGDGLCNGGDADDDGDGIPDIVEVGAGDPDGDGIPSDQDTDSDGDGIDDIVEGTNDADGDGILDAYETDSDDDGIPDSVEGSGDADGDGIPNYADT